MSTRLVSVPPEFQAPAYAVLGAGKSGQAIARLLRWLRPGAPPRVVLLDDQLAPGRPELQALREEGIEVATGHPAGAADLDGIATLIVSPGIPQAHPAYAAARARGLALTGELELAWLASRHMLAGAAPRYCAITGTNGKTTVTELLHRMLGDAGRAAVAAGNIGYALADAVREHAAQLAELFVALEVSSFQLETTHAFAPDVAVCLNITPDHLDRYAGRMDLYAAAKQRITAAQGPGQVLVINQDDPACLAIGAASRARVRRFSLERPVEDGAWLDGDLLYLAEPGRKPKRLLAMDELQLVGLHNVANALAALVAADALGLPREGLLATLRAFRAAPHRMEPLGERGGVTFINDSKATNLDAMARALESFPQGVHLIAGGRDKASPFAQYAARLAGRVKAAYLIGEAAGDMHAAWAGTVPCELSGTLPAALEHATARACEGDVVLLSPACASFDQFTSYAHRGEVFRAWVAEWLKHPATQTQSAT